MQYRIQQITQEKNTSDEIFVHMQWITEQHQTDLNKVYFKVQALEQNNTDPAISYVVEEYQVNADILANDAHVKGCAKYILDPQTPRQFSSRCSCREIKEMQAGTKIIKDGDPITVDNLRALLQTLQSTASSQLDEE